MLAACDGGGGADDDAVPACISVDFDLTECAPLYQPTFDNVYQNTLLPGCVFEGGSCHSDAQASGATANGLEFSSADAAHAALMGDAGGRPFVDVEDVSCSLFFVRLAVDDADLRMPPGESPRSDAELCAIAQWIEGGAQR